MGAGYDSWSDDAEYSGTHSVGGRTHRVPVRRGHFRHLMTVAAVDMLVMFAPTLGAGLFIYNDFGTVSAILLLTVLAWDLMWLSARARHERRQPR